MFKAYGLVSGNYTPHIRSYPVYNLAITKGALLTYTPVATAGQESVALATTDTASWIIGIACNAVSTAVATQTYIDVELIGPQTLIEADIEEIRDATAISADSGSGTTFVDSDFDGLATYSLIGGVLEVITMASGDAAPGTQLTITNYTTGTGTLTFASVGSTGFAASDTAKLVRIGYNEKKCNATGNYQVGINGEANAIELLQALDGDFFRVIGCSSDGTKLHGYITMCGGAPTALSA